MSTSEAARRAQQRQELKRGVIVGRRILRLHEVEARTGRSSSSIYEDIRAGRFPASVPIGLRAVGWLEDEIEQWIAARVAERDATLQRGDVQ